VPWALFLEVKRPGHKADHSPHILPLSGSKPPIFQPVASFALISVFLSKFSHLYTSEIS